MKKGWKFFWILIGCIGGLGLILTLASILVGFSYRGTFHDFSKPGRDFARKMEKRVEFIDKDEDQENDNEDDDYDDNFFCSLSSEKEYEQIDTLKLKVDFGEISILTSNDDNVHIKSCKHMDSNQLEITQNGKELVLVSKTPLKRWPRRHKHSEIAIYLPKNTALKTLDISMDAGKIDAEPLYVDHLNLELAAGSCSLEDLKAGFVSAKIDTGEFDLEGSIEHDLAIDCSVGKVDVTLDSASTDYNYTVMCDAGTVTIDETSYSGLTSQKTYDNHSSKNINLNCTLGTIDLEFSE